jgi:hypothetical protein
MTFLVTGHSGDDTFEDFFGDLALASLLFPTGFLNGFVEFTFVFLATVDYPSFASAASRSIKQSSFVL